MKKFSNIEQQYQQQNNNSGLGCMLLSNCEDFSS